MISALDWYPHSNNTRSCRPYLRKYGSLSHRPSDPAYYIVNWRISRVRSSFTNLQKVSTSNLIFHKTLKKQISPETILARVQDYIGAIKSQPNHVHLSFKVIKVDRVFSINQNLSSIWWAWDYYSPLLKVLQSVVKVERFCNPINSIIAMADFLFWLKKILFHDFH